MPRTPTPTSLETWRLNVGVSVEQMAADFGWNRGSMYRLLRASQWPRPETIVRVETYTEGAVTASAMARDHIRVAATPVPDPATQAFEDALS